MIIGLGSDLCNIERIQNSLDIGVVNLPSGQPTLALTGGARERLDAITPAGHVARVHLTMTDDHPFALAVVIITAETEERRT